MLTSEDASVMTEQVAQLRYANSLIEQLYCVERTSCWL